MIDGLKLMEQNRVKQELLEECERVGEWGVIWGVGGMVCEKKFPAHILQLSLFKLII
jgi:hypothetical protein